jgi:hypothetical protein
MEIFYNFFLVNFLIFQVMYLNPNSWLFFIIELIKQKENKKRGAKKERKFPWKDLNPISRLLVVYNIIVF